MSRHIPETPVESPLAMVSRRGQAAGPDEHADCKGIRLVIADHPRNCANRVNALQSCDTRFLIAGTAHNLVDALALTRKLAADVLLLNLALYAAEVSQECVELSTTARIVAIAPVLDKWHLIDAVRLGASGVVPMDAAPTLVARSIQAVRWGRYWIDDDSIHLLVEALRETVVSNCRGVRREDYGLTPREFEIVAQIASGRSNREVSETIRISERTVKHHLTNIFNKLGISSRLQLARFAFTHQVMEAPVSRVGTRTERNSGLSAAGFTLESTENR